MTKLRTLQNQQINFSTCVENNRDNLEYPDVSEDCKPNDLILQSAEIYRQAVLTYKPAATVLMFSGGDDSLTTYEVIKELGIKIDFVIHGNTRTGIQETTDFVIKEVERRKDKLLIADAGTSYTDYVLRKGFFGKGKQAHNYSYHILKQKHFRRVTSQNIRHRKRNFPILFLNGGRQDESTDRQKHFVNPCIVSPDCKSDIWVNLINHWTKENCKSYLAGGAVQRNPVAVNLCRSGECMCGTMQTQGDRIEASYFYPRWSAWLYQLEQVAIRLHGYGWNDQGKSKVSAPVVPFQPMCAGCKVKFAGGETVTAGSADATPAFLHL